MRNLQTTLTQDRVSRLGLYSGYSVPQYTEWVRTSQYVTVRDGTKLAVDIIRPAVGGNVVGERLPVLLTHERYHRAMKLPDDGPLLAQMGLTKLPDSSPLLAQPELKFGPFVKTWLRYGYVIIASDMRGTGASFGTRANEFLDVDGTDAADIIDWISRQPWSNGKVGMYGLSYPGITQWLAASAAPPALKAITPTMTLFDYYHFAYPGGIYLEKPIVMWANMVNDQLDKHVPPVPVDEDTDGSMAKAAQQEHLANSKIDQLLSKLPFRDSVDPTLQQQIFPGCLDRLLPAINQSAVAVYDIAGWYDGWAYDQALWFNNLALPKRVLFTPFDHVYGFNAGWQHLSARLLKDDFRPQQIVTFLNAELLRFFDFHLKDIDNGIMDEPPVWYYTLGAPAGQGWRSAAAWPLPNQILTPYYFQAGRSGSGSSTNDGMLTTTAPAGVVGQDFYRIDYTTTMGPDTRWQRMVGGTFAYGDMSEQGKKSLSYTTAPLADPLEITGHPVVHLWMSSSAQDGDFFVYLEKVDAEGYVHYLTEGVLRASHRTLTQPPYLMMGLPYHRSFKEDILPLPRNEPVELIVDLLPTSVLYQPGERIRVRVVGADAETFQTPSIDPEPTISIYCNCAHASYIELPLIPAE